ncbi:uncharacterized protein [Physeter macrocephalus]|uniref:Uncharacterized protein n=1 Tax=Physeter macrocephalus TaxID=9755 RepID=A0A9W2WZB7_PHYMC|nr:uncharacterized protein LOC129392557 [Physeter catodon]
MLEPPPPPLAPPPLPRPHARPALSPHPTLPPRCDPDGSLTSHSRRSEQLILSCGRASAKRAALPPPAAGARERGWRRLLPRRGLRAGRTRAAGIETAGGGSAFPPQVLPARGPGSLWAEAGLHPLSGVLCEVGGARNDQSGRGAADSPSSPGGRPSIASASVLPALFFPVRKMQPEVGKRWREDCGQRLRLFSLSSPHPWAARALSRGKEPGVRTGHSGIPSRTPRMCPSYSTVGTFTLEDGVA